VTLKSKLLIPSAIEDDETDEVQSGLTGGEEASTTPIKVLSKGAHGRNCKVEVAGEDFGRTKGTVAGAGEDSGRTKAVGENEAHCRIEGTGVPSIVGMYEYFNSVGVVASGTDELLRTLLFNELKGVGGN
jgi:hypothetical protein